MLCPCHASQEMGNSKAGSCQGTTWWWVYGLCKNVQGLTTAHFQKLLQHWLPELLWSRKVPICVAGFVKSNVNGSMGLACVKHVNQMCYKQNVWQLAWAVNHLMKAQYSMQLTVKAFHQLGYKFYFYNSGRVKLGLREHSSSCYGQKMQLFSDNKCFIDLRAGASAYSNLQKAFRFWAKHLKYY